MTDGRGRPSPSETARLLRQRAELGLGSLILGDLTREQAIALARAARAGRVSEPAPSLPDAPVRASASARDPAPPPADLPGLRPDGVRPSRDPAPTAPSSTRSTSTRSTPTGAPLPVLPDRYDELREVALSCTRCGLSEGRTQVVFSDGPTDARLMVVGEAPGANEDATGIPFVGAAGKYLDLLLATVGLSRKESVYIANVLKCRPPANRDPTPGEIELCSPFLKKQIDLVRPEVLLAVGSFSAKLLTGRDKSALGKLRGEVHSYHGVPLVVTYHPAALLRNGNWTRPFWDDLQLLRSLLDA